MTLASGSSLGVYRISGLLGKGEMGEVYRAPTAGQVNPPLPVRLNVVLDWLDEVKARAPRPLAPCRW